MSCRMIIVLAVLSYLGIYWVNPPWLVPFLLWVCFPLVWADVQRQLDHFDKVNDECTREYERLHPSAPDGA
jgi:hypothetical protein